MNKFIIAVVCAFVIYTAYALNLNTDCDGKLCNLTHTGEQMNKQLAENELEFLYEQEKQLEKALAHIREAIRENINYLNKNKESHEPT